MIITIYDYANNTKEITLPNKEIAEIFVNILSGDETGFVKFTDGTKIKFDASDDRIAAYYDGMYTLEGENIKKWIDFKPSGNRTVSYERYGIFDTEDEDEDVTSEDIKNADVIEVVRCKYCRHRGDSAYCPMYIEVETEMDDGDGYMVDDWIDIDKTQDDGFCHKGER